MPSSFTTVVTLMTAEWQTTRRYEHGWGLFLDREIMND
jgi:hypothetical protein